MLVTQIQCKLACKQGQGCICASVFLFLSPFLSPFLCMFWSDSHVPEDGKDGRRKPPTCSSRLWPKGNEHRPLHPSIHIANLHENSGHHGSEGVAVHKTDHRNLDSAAGTWAHRCARVEGDQEGKTEDHGKWGPQEERMPLQGAGQARPTAATSPGASAPSTGLFSPRHSVLHLAQPILVHMGHSVSSGSSSHVDLPRVVSQCVQIPFICPVFPLPLFILLSPPQHIDLVFWSYSIVSVRVFLLRHTWTLERKNGEKVKSRAIVKNISV